MKDMVRLFAVMMLLLVVPVSGHTQEGETPLEKSMSRTLDAWREGRYELLFDMLSKRGKVSREQFIVKMRDTSVRPACCWEKMEKFTVLSEKTSEATVYVKIGLEGTPLDTKSITREFKLTNQGGDWKMHLSDIFSIAGISPVKSPPKKRHSRKILTYN